MATNREGSAPIPANQHGVGVAELDTGELVACVFQTHADKEDTVIRIGFTKRAVDQFIAAAERCKAQLPD